MPITLANARSDLRSRLNEATSAFYADADLNNWLNEGCRDLARRTKSLWDKSSLPVVAGNQTFTAPSGMLQAHRVEFAPTLGSQVYPLEFRNYQEMDAIWGTWQTISQYTPTVWTLYFSPPNAQIIIFPVPSQAGTLNIYYFRNAVAAAGDASNLDVVEGWWDAVIEYAEFTALFKALDPRWKECKAHYDEKVMGLIEQAAQFSDSVGSISPYSTLGSLYPFQMGQWGY